MATPVEERDRRGVPVWLWVLLALVAAALLLWLLLGLMGGDDIDETDAGATDPGATAPVAPGDSETTEAETDEETTVAAGEGETTTESEQGEATGAGSAEISSIAAVLDGDPAEVVGQQVQLEDVIVQDVVGDKTFWVGSDPDEQLFVLLEEELDTAGVEGEVDVNADQTVTITGTVREMPPIEQAREQFELDEDNSATLEGEEVYVEATEVEIAGS